MPLKQNLRKTIRKAHLAFDGFLGRTFTAQGALGKRAEKPHHPIHSEDLSRFSYSQSWHFTKFNILPTHKGQSLATCDLKVYQDSFAYTFIRDNLPKGARILEIGGGESRIIKTIQNDYDIWNLDKLEGSGFGPTALIDDQGFHLVRDYIGAFSPELPEENFDLVYSVSTVEHFSRQPEAVQAIIDDMHRLLKPGGYCLHCVDAILYPDHYFVHPLVEKVHNLGLPTYPLVTYEVLKANDDLWTLPPFAFYTRWYHLVKEPLNKFGCPFSINLVWQK